MDGIKNKIQNYGKINLIFDSQIANLINYNNYDIKRRISGINQFIKRFK